MAKSYAACAACGSVNRYDLERSDSATCGRCKQALPVHGAVTDVNEVGVAKLVASSPLPVVVDFWAPWCAPCRSFAPAFEAVAERLAGRFIFAKANTEAHPAVGNTHRVRGIPTLIVFENGREATRQSGAMDAKTFERWLTAGRAGATPS